MPKTGLDIHSLVKPAPEKLRDKNLKGLPLNGLWIPFFTATNVTGETSLTPGALGAPMQLVHNKAGAVKLKEVTDPDGKILRYEPVYAPNRELKAGASAVIENFAFGLSAYAAAIQKARPEEWKAQVAAAQKAGEEIRAHEEMTLGRLLPQIDPTPTTTPERELVPA